MENWEKLFCEGRGWCCFLNKEFHLEYVEFKITTRPSGRGTYHKNLETNIKIWSLAKGSGTEGNPEREMYLRRRKKKSHGEQQRSNKNRVERFWTCGKNRR